MNVSDKLVVAALALEEKGKRPFSAEDLVVSAWEKFPDTFGLAGHSHPDSNRVFAEIMGRKPIRSRGFLVKTGLKSYQLTEAGREYAKRLISGDRKGSTEKIGIERETREALARLLTTKAFEKTKGGKIDAITFFDACTFLGITPGSSSIQLQGRLENVARIISKAKESAGEKNFAIEHGGSALTKGDLETLGKTHEILQEKFAQEIEVIMRRTDER